MTKPGRDGVTVIIPHIPSRGERLGQALTSVARQVRPASSIIVETDLDRSGSAITRNRALGRVDTDWVAFLDDDDEFLPEHLQVLMTHASDDVDVVYTGCKVVGPHGTIIRRREEWGRFGQPFNPDLLRRKAYLPVTSLARTHMAQVAGFGAPSGSHYDDWGFYLRMLGDGARFLHVPVVTWVWNHHGQNTSGLAERRP